MKLTLALAQINTHLGDVAANLEKHLALIQEGADRWSGPADIPRAFTDGLCVAGSGFGGRPETHC